MTAPPGKLVVSELCKSYAGVDGPLRILNGVNLEVSRGGAVAVTGPSGCGKSTLLYILGTLDTPTSGSVSILDRDPFGLSQKELSWFRSESVGFLSLIHI